jgi:sn-glycerol 3-phosphate transport system permease protein
MVERTPWLTALTHASLLLGIVLVGLPVYLAFVAATHTALEVNAVPMPLVPGGHLLDNLAVAWRKGQLGRQMGNSLVMAVGIATGKIAISLLSAFALVYFRFPLRMAAFWAIFVSLLLPVEVRIVPTYEVAANALTPFVWLARHAGLEGLLGLLCGHTVSLDLKWSLLNRYEGLILPLIASATATFLFRQFFLTVPDELAEAAQIDGAGPLHFFWHVLLPLSTTNMAALGVILFIYGWNQYLWPLLITTRPEMDTIVMGITRLTPGMDSVPAWNLVMAASLLALLPPIAVVLVLQRWFVKGLIESEK